MTEHLAAARPGRDRLWQLYLLAAAVALPVYYGLGALGVAGAVAQDVLYSVAGFGAAGAMFAGVSLHRPGNRTPWLLFATAQLSLAAGDLAWNVLAAIGAQPFPSVADVAYLAAYPLMTIGFVKLIRRRPVGSGIAVLLDAGIMATGLSLVLWVLLVEPVLRQAGLSPLARLVSVAYPIADGLVIAILAGLLLGTAASTPAIRLLAGGLAVMLLADVGFALIQFPVDGVGPADALYLVEYALWAAAALHPSMRERVFLSIDDEHRIGGLRLAVLAACGAIPAGLLGVEAVLRLPVDYAAIVVGWLVMGALIVACVADLVRGQARAMARRQALEAQLRETSETLAAMLDASPLAIFVIDRERRVRFWSREAERLYGWARDEVLGLPLPIVPLEREQPLALTLDRVFSGAPAVLDDVAQRTKPGENLTVRLYLAPIEDGGGPVWGVIGVNEDLSGVRRLEAELFEARKMESVGRLAGGIAHDFNNILTAIVGFADLSLMEPDAPDIRDNLLGIRASAERAAGLTKQLLAFSRRQVLQPQVLDANNVLAGLESMLGRLIGEHVELRIELSDESVCMRADRTQLEQVILNLALNARDAMPGGGRLTISASRETFVAAGPAQARVRGSGDYVIISVADTGVGMDDETKGRIFEPFFTTKGVGQGTGLGLATTYGIVKQSGAYIDCDSAPGAGTTFRLYFPAADEGPGEATIEAHATVARSGRILLVEDEPVLRELAGRVLSRAGFDVISTSDAAHAIGLADTHPGPIDLVLTDVVMPGMRGPELARQLRHRRPALRVLLTSGYADEIVEADALDTAFLAKPFTPDTLLEAVDGALRQAG